MKIGFIGYGNLAKAMAAGILESGILSADDILTSHLRADNQAVADFADTIFLTVKPQIYKEVLEQLTGLENKVIISVTPGITVDNLEKWSGSQKIVRSMPNTPAQIGEGVTTLYKTAAVTTDEYAFVKALFESFSKVYEFADEAQIDESISVSGSSPAYAYLLMEAMVAEAEKQGFSYADAKNMAAQTLLGTAKMVLASDEKISVFREAVSSKGGTTIAAVNVLKEEKFPEAVADAMQAAMRRAHEMADDYNQ